MDCIFCKIINKEIPTDFEREDEDLVAFADINPKAPVHLLIVPKKHLKDLSEADDVLWGKIRQMALEIAKAKGLSGFRLATNVGDTALISHMHVHLLGGITKERKI
jgi:histidine triad (HIT) family protein